MFAALATRSGSPSISDLSCAARSPYRSALRIWLVAGELRPAHHPAVGAGVVDRQVLDRAVVPECHRAFFPAEAAGEFGAVAVLEEVIEQRPRLLLGHALEADRVGLVDVEQLAAGLGVGAHYGVQVDRLAPAIVAAHLGRAVLVA